MCVSLISGNFPTIKFDTSQEKDGNLFDRITRKYQQVIRKN